MTRLYNKFSERYKRKLLRRNVPEAEQALWFYIRQEKLGWRFRRQYSVGPFVVDFYCPQAKLAIELDGSSHRSPDSREYDAEREKFLEAANVHVLRFKNQQIIESVDEVLKQIRQILGDPYVASSLPLTKGEDGGGVARK